jgi:hypothetical protein
VLEKSLPATPYILVCHGTTLTVFGGPDSYTILHAGAMVELSQGIHLRPEIGGALTSKHVSGGSSVFGGNFPITTEDKSVLGVNLTIELDLRSLP